MSGPREQRPRLVHRGAEHLVYRSRDPKGRVRVLKVPASSPPNPNALAWLRHEHEMLMGLQLPGVVRCFGVEQFLGRPALVLEDAGPRNLAHLLAGGPLPALRFVDLAGAILHTLEGLHRAGVIHRGIHPRNIVLDVTGTRVTLIDFAMAASLKEVGQDVLGPGDTHGDLHYIAPEQTGRVNRVVDNRADLYALGATFYEMLVGGPPFRAHDPLELVHAHVARTPEPPHKVHDQVPEALSELVLKLLAKSPDDRYQSARGVAHDLRAIGERLRRGQTGPYTLGRLDRPRGLRVPRKLLGRDQEQAALTEALQRSRRGEGGVVVVGGPRGAGRSALLAWLREPGLSQGGLFGLGRFSEDHRGLPLRGWVMAVRALLRQVLAAPAQMTQLWGERVASQLGEDSDGLKRRLPELADLLPDGLESAEGVVGAGRLGEALLRLLGALAMPGRSLCIALDDAQWADEASLRLMERVSTTLRPEALVLVVADSGPTAGQLVGPRGGQRLRLLLSPLKLSETVALCAGALGERPEAVKPLAEILQEKTAGVPGSLVQLLQGLHRSGDLTPTEGGWAWDLKQLRSVDVSEHLVEVALGLLRGLPPDARALTEHAACLHDPFALRDLAAAIGLPLQQVSALLWTCADAGLLMPIEQAFRLPRAPSDPRWEAADLQLSAHFRFAHPRLRLEAQALSTPEALAQRRLQVVRRLFLGSSLKELDERLMLMVELIEDVDPATLRPLERLRFARLCQRAARLTRLQGAPRRAQELADRGLRLVETLSGVDPDQAVERALLLVGAQAAVEGGDPVGAAPLLERAMVSAKSWEERLPLYTLQVQRAVVSGEMAGAMAWGRRGLRELGVLLPDSPTQAELDQTLRGLRRTLRSDLTPLLDLRMADHPQSIGALGLMNALLVAALAGDARQRVVVAVAAVRLTLFRGQAVGSALAVTTLGSLMIERLQDFDLGEQLLAVAPEMAARSPDPGAALLVQAVTLGRVRVLSEPTWRVAAQLRELRRRAQTQGESRLAVWCLAREAEVMLLGGVDLGEVGTVLAEALGPARLPGRPLSRGALNAMLRALTRLGVSPGLGALEPEVSSRAAHPELLSAVLDAQRVLVLDDRSAMVRALRGLEAPVRPACDALLELHSRQLKALLHARIAQATDDSSERSLQLAAVDEHMHRLKGWQPAAGGLVAALSAAPTALTEALRGRPLKAMVALDRAIDLAREQGSVRDEAMACAAAGGHALTQGRRSAARLYLRASHQAWMGWGARRPALALARAFPQFELSAELGGPVNADLGGALDHRSVVKAALAIGRELELDRLLESMLTVLLEVAGAQRAWLLLREDGGLKVRARGQVGRRPEVLNLELSQVPEISQRLVRYVQRTGQSMVLDDAVGGGLAEGEFATDTVIRERAPRSLMCVPVVSRSENLALLYAENQLVSGAFSLERMELLELISSQVAIALRNAMLVEDLRREVVERQQAEHALRHLAQELEDRVQRRTTELSAANRDLLLVNQELESFTFSVSHDLRNPLSLAQRYTALLRQRFGDRLPADGLRFLARTERGHTRMNQLIDDLLMLSQVTRSELQVQRVNLSELAAQVVAELQEAAPERPCELTLQGELVVHADPRLLRVAMENLLSNAWKYSADKDAVRIQVYRESLDGTPTVFIRDHGMGFDVAAAGPIFEPFQRLHGGEVKGTGVGLSIVHRVFARHGGRVFVHHAEPGRGACMGFQLPSSSRSGSDGA